MKRKRPTIPGFLTLREVAKQLKLTYSTVLQAQTRGLLKSTMQIGRSHLCTQSQIDEYAAHRQGRK